MQPKSNNVLLHTCPYDSHKHHDETGRSNDDTNKKQHAQESTSKRSGARNETSSGIAQEILLFKTWPKMMPGVIRARKGGLEYITSSWWVLQGGRTQHMGLISEGCLKRPVRRASSLYAKRGTSRRTCSSNLWFFPFGKNFARATVLAILKFSKRIQTFQPSKISTVAYCQKVLAFRHSHEWVAPRHKILFPLNL